MRLGEIRLFLEYHLLRIVYGSPKIIDRIKTSELLRDHSDLSLTRLGDGELSMIFSKKDIGFQKYDDALVRRLKEIVREASNDKLLVCLPDCYASVRKFKKDIKIYWSVWVNRNRKSTMKLINKANVYGDTNMTRLYLPWQDKSFESGILSNIKSTWEGKRIVVVEGKETRFGVGNDLFGNAKSVQRILCPAENAWEKYHDILAACRTIKLCGGGLILSL